MTDPSLASIAAVIVASLSLVAFAGILLVAAFGDMQRYLIPNKLSALVLGSYAVFVLSAPFLPEFYPSINWFGALIVGGLVLAAGAALFYWGIVGGGDVKLLASTSVWAGPAMVFDLLFVTALAGGVLAILVLAAQRVRLRTSTGMDDADGEDRKVIHLPYGVAIACGGLLVAGKLAETFVSVALHHGPW